MIIDTNNLVSITEANQNFSKVARMVDENGSVVVLKNNAPKYLIISFEHADKENYLDDSELLYISDQLMKKNQQAYDVLAK